jgi:hypothetical protein
MILDNITDLSGLFIGIVKKTDAIGRKLGIYISKLMPAISESSPTYQENINIDSINLASTKTNLDVAENIYTVPYIWVDMMNADDKLPDIGSRVGVIFLDGQITKGLAFKFNKNNDYVPIQSEKYSPLSALSIQNKNIIIRENDIVNLTLPESLFNVIYSYDAEAKTHNYNI